MLLTLLLLACTSDEVPTGDTAAACDEVAELDAVRAATEAYTDVQAALDAGYLATGGCEPGMGIHYTRPAAALDDEIDPLAPEVLLYVPEGDGVRLVGVEYTVPAFVDGEMVFGADGAGASFEPAPEVLCQVMHGPMEGHSSLQPWHYDLHVWLYSDNPDGTFAEYHPDEDCTP